MGHHQRRQQRVLAGRPRQLHDPAGQQPQSRQRCGLHHAAEHVQRFERRPGAGRRAQLRTRDVEARIRLRVPEPRAPGGHQLPQLQPWLVKLEGAGCSPRMRQLTIPTLALTALAAVGAASQAVEQTSLGLSAVRYWRPAAGQTVVDVFARVPVAAVSALGAEGSDGAFRFAVVVQDSSGLRLLSQAWTETVGDAILRVRGASVGEHLTFAARAGRYTVEAVVTDSASGRVARQQITVEAFAAPPAASDLLLGTGLRGLEDSTVRSGEIRKGGVAVQTSGEPVLTPQAAKLGYYLELYPARAETLTVSLRVLTAAGSPVIAAPSERLPVGAGGAVTHEIVDLTGLPPGRYRLEVTAGGRVDTVRRTAGFGMSGFETAA